MWSERSFIVKFQFKSFAIMLKVIDIVLVQNWCDFFSGWRRNKGSAIKYLFVLNISLFRKDNGENQLFYVNWILIYTLSRYTIK